MAFDANHLAVVVDFGAALALPHMERDEVAKNKALAKVVRFIGDYSDASVSSDQGE